jgi:hypothetical protein
MTLLSWPLSKPANTSFSLLLKVANLFWRIRVSALDGQMSFSDINAERTEASSAPASNGFSKKSIAPRFIASTAR